MQENRAPLCSHAQFAPQLVYAKKNSLVNIPNLFLMHIYDWVLVNDNKSDSRNGIARDYVCDTHVTHTSKRLNKLYSMNKSNKLKRNWPVSIFMKIHIIEVDLNNERAPQFHENFEIFIQSNLHFIVCQILAVFTVIWVYWGGGVSSG